MKLVMCVKILTLNGRDVGGVRQVAFNPNFNVREGRELDRCPDVVRGALLEQDGRVGGVVSSSQGSS